MLAGFIGVFGWYPQVRRVWGDKRADGVSDKVNPGSVILSGEMMLRYMGWTEAADLIVDGMQKAIGAKTGTYDFERLMDGAKLLKCSEFGDAIIDNL